MGDKTQQKIVDAARKAQQAAMDNEFKRRARSEALQIAMKINMGGNAESVTKEAEKIYQWLIKGV